MPSSPRGIRLFHTPGTEAPFVTVEDYDKWYDVFIVMEDGSVRNLLEYDPAIANHIADCLDEPDCADHVFNPLYISQLAAHFGFEVDIRALEVLVGRWFLEYKNYLA